MMLASYQTDASINVKKSDPSSSFQVGGGRLGPFQQDFMLNLTPCSLALHITVDSCLVPRIWPLCGCHPLLRYFSISRIIPLQSWMSAST